jgi:hypothetical protein
MTFRDLDHPTVEEVCEDMLRRLRYSLDHELAFLASVIRSNEAQGGRINRKRSVAYGIRHANIQRTRNALEAGLITVTVSNPNKED